MGADPITAGLGAVSLVSGMNQAKKAEGAQKKAANAQKQIAERAVKLFDRMFNEVEAAQKNGQFNPTDAIAQTRKWALQDEDKGMRNMGSAFSAAGYVPGTSEIGRAMSSYKSRSSEVMDRMSLDLRRQAFADLLNAYGSINTGSLGMASNIQQGLGQQAAAQSPNPMGFFQSIMPFLGQNSAKSGATSGGQQAWNIASGIGNGIGSMFK